MQRLTPRLSATSRASCTRSVACASPSGCTMNSRWPRGGSPRRASTLVMPASQITASCSSSSLREAPTQVRWAIASISVSRLMRVTISSVRPREDPPAPQVTLAKEGARGRSARSVSKSAATPASFLGGKNSKEKTGSPRSAAKRSMSVILICPDSPPRTLLRRGIASGACGNGAASCRNPPRCGRDPRRPPPPGGERNAARFRAFGQREGIDHLPRDVLHRSAGVTSAYVHRRVGERGRRRLDARDRRVGLLQRSSAAAQHEVADAVDLPPLVEGLVPGEDSLDRMDLVRAGDGGAHLLAASAALALLRRVGERSLVHEHP